MRHAVCARRVSRQVLSLSGFTAALGLSDTLGAFLAGVLLAETKYRYQIEADIAPFRGLLLGLFFITTGFSIDLRLAVSSWQLVLGMALGLHALKTALTAAVCLLSGLQLSVAIRSGLLLSQGGEFAFVIFALAQQHGLLMPKQVKLLLTVVVVTMFLTPFLNDLGAKLSSAMERRSGRILLPRPDEAEPSDFILICGFGRVGQAVANLLTKKLVRYKAFDMDPYRVAEARELGLPVFFGDATRPEVLNVLIAEQKASLKGIVVALDNERDCTKAVRALRREYPTVGEMPIFVRATDEKHRRKVRARMRRTRCSMRCSARCSMRVPPPHTLHTLPCEAPERVSPVSVHPAASRVHCRCDSWLPRAPPPSRLDRKSRPCCSAARCSPRWACQRKRRAAHARTRAL